MSANSTTDKNQQSWITVLSATLSILLFLLCLWFAFESKFTTATAVANSPLSSYDSTITTVKKDTSVTEAGKKVVINNTTVTTKNTGNNQTATPVKDDTKEKLDTVFKYFVLLLSLFVMLALLPRLKSFNVSKDGVQAEFNEYKEALNEAQNKSNQTQAIVTGGKNETLESRSNFTIKNLTENKNEVDPQKDKWGGEAERNYRKLTATISKIDKSEWVDIILRVESTDPVNHPLKGIVSFHLHPTFVNPNPVIFVINGVALLNIKAWGAFTVGAEADGGITKLELDLEHHPDAREPFKSR
ncbi:pYEATS domain-containing protein [Ferruginibacter sp.]